MVFKQKNSNRWWYKFVWNRELIRESTKQANKRIAEQLKAAHEAALWPRALEGIRTMRGQEPIKPEDPFLLRDLTALLIDCELRPEEAFRLRWNELRDRAVEMKSDDGPRPELANC